MSHAHKVRARGCAVAAAVLTALAVAAPANAATMVETPTAGALNFTQPSDLTGFHFVITERKAG